MLCKLLSVSGIAYHWIAENAFFFPFTLMIPHREALKLSEALTIKSNKLSFLYLKLLVFICSILEEKYP